MKKNKIAQKAAQIQSVFSQPAPHRSLVSLHLWLLGDLANILSVFSYTLPFSRLLHIYMPTFYFCLYITLLEDNYLHLKLFRPWKLVTKFDFQRNSTHMPTKVNNHSSPTSQTRKELCFYFISLHLIMEPFSRCKHWAQSPKLKRKKGILLQCLLFLLEPFCSYTSALPWEGFGRCQLKSALRTKHLKAWWFTDLKPRNAPVLIPSSIFTFLPPS